MLHPRIIFSRPVHEGTSTRVTLDGVSGVWQRIIVVTSYQKTCSQLSKNTRTGTPGSKWDQSCTNGSSSWCTLGVSLLYKTNLSTTKQLPGPWLNIKLSSYQYRKSHCGDKAVVRSSYLHNGISYTGKMSSLYWISPQVTNHQILSNTVCLMVVNAIGKLCHEYDSCDTISQLSCWWLGAHMAPCHLTLHSTWWCKSVGANKSQLSCNDICQIWTWYIIVNQCFNN